MKFKILTIIAAMTISSIALSEGQTVDQKNQIQDNTDYSSIGILNPQQNAAAEAAEVGRAFLDSNRLVPGVKFTPSGLQYKIIKEGSGNRPTLNDTVTVNYRGSLLDGKVFDSSYQRGKPTTFQISNVIKGWQEGLMMMKPGAVWMLYIPAKLAYGEQGAGPIGPNQTLIFEVQLISVH